MKLINLIFRFLHFRTLRKVFGLDKSEVKALTAMECTASFVTPCELTVNEYLECCATDEEADAQFNRTYELVKRLSAYRKIEEMQRKALAKCERIKADQEELLQRLIKCQ